MPGNVIGIGTSAKPDDALSAAFQVEVFECLGETTRYAARYELDIVESDFPALLESKLGPNGSLWIQTQLGDAAVFLAVGPVSGQLIHFEHGGGDSCLEVRGGDYRLLMDREWKRVLWDGLSDSAVAEKVLTPYVFKVDKDDTVCIHEQDSHALLQCETDLALVRRLACRNGLLLWISYDDKGRATAKFKLPPVITQPVATLVINDNAKGPNIRALDLEWESERPTSVFARQLNPRTKAVGDGSAAVSRLPPLAALPFAAIATGVRRSQLSTPVDDGAELGVRASALLEDASFFVRAECSTTVEDLQAILHAGDVVSVSGLGTRHSGNYLVSKVHHVLDARAHHMHLELKRNGWAA